MKKVLLVCVENARRSQMVEAFFNKLLRLSRARPASKVDEKAVEVIKEIGIDITKQKPKTLTMKMVKEAVPCDNHGLWSRCLSRSSKTSRRMENRRPSRETHCKVQRGKKRNQKKVEKLVKALED